MIKLSKINTIHGKEMSEPIFDILKVDTMTDVNGIEVQIPVVVETTTATEIRNKIQKFQEITAELQSQLDASKEISKTKADKEVVEVKEDITPIDIKL